MASVIVLGAGIVGVSTALSLQERGWQVTLLDREGTGLETSFGNAGIIQADAPEPPPMPREFARLFAIATGQSRDIRYRLADLPSHSIALGRYWWHSKPERHRLLCMNYARLAAAATTEHQHWLDAADANHFVRRDGYRVIFRTARTLDQATMAAERLERDYGLPFRLLSSSEFATAEPAVRPRMAGALQMMAAWTVNDPGRLVAAYSELLVRQGGSLVHGDARQVRRTPAGWSIDAGLGAIEAEHIVVALGPWSPEFLRRFGGRVRMIPKRGYHTHIAGPSPLDLLLIDADKGYLMAPMAKGLRITTGVEIAKMDAPADFAQLRSAEANARQTLDLDGRERTAAWMGTRPFLPGMIPIIGQSCRDRQLWMNFGHGHQGFTIGPATGRMLAELMTGGRTFVDATPFCPKRHKL